jgi:hypothetical protein
MRQKQSHSESHGKGGVEKPLTGAEANAEESIALSKQPMEQFKALAVKLLSVTREELTEEKRKYEEAKENKKSTIIP